MSKPIERGDLLKLARDRLELELEVIGLEIEAWEVQVAYEQAKARLLGSALADGTISGKNKEERDIQINAALANDEGIAAHFKAYIDKEEESRLARARTNHAGDELNIHILWAERFWPIVEDEELPF